MKHRFKTPLDALQFISRNCRFVDEDNRSGVWTVKQPMSLRVNGAIDCVSHFTHVYRGWDNKSKQGYAVIEGTNKL